ncbi:MAG TPA: phosphatase PAP2 family protein, partial [Bacteroidales bacterium]
IAFFITFKWKISAHTMASGCVVTSIFLFCLNSAIYPLPFLIGLLLLAGLQASSRLYLKVHTLEQVCGGFCLGAISVSCAFFFL